MNQARIWLVVKPGYGIPLILGTVAVVALIVHIGILTHTTWYPAYLQGNQHVKASAMNTVTAPVSVATR